MDIVNYVKGSGSFGDRFVTLMRGATEEEAWNIASYHTAGGKYRRITRNFVRSGPSQA